MELDVAGKTVSGERVSLSGGRAGVEQSPAGNDVRRRVVRIRDSLPFRGDLLRRTMRSGRLHLLRRWVGRSCRELLLLFRVRGLLVHRSADITLRRRRRMTRGTCQASHSGRSLTSAIPAPGSDCAPPTQEASHPGRASTLPLPSPPRAPSQMPSPLPSRHSHAARSSSSWLRGAFPVRPQSSYARTASPTNGSGPPVLSSKGLNTPASAPSLPSATSSGSRPPHHGPRPWHSGSVSTTAKCSPALATPKPRSTVFSN